MTLNILLILYRIQIWYGYINIRKREMVFGEIPVTKNELAVFKRSFGDHVRYAPISYINMHINMHVRFAAVRLAKFIPGSLRVYMAFNI